MKKSKKLLSLTIVLTLLLSMFAAIPASAATQLDPDMDEIYIEGQDQNSYKSSHTTLGAAIDHAVAGDVIVIPETYVDPVTSVQNEVTLSNASYLLIQKSLKIKGSNPVNPAKIIAPNAIIIRNTDDKVTVKNVTLENLNIVSTDHEGYGIVIRDCENVALNNVRIENTVTSTATLEINGASVSVSELTVVTNGADRIAVLLKNDPSFDSNTNQNGHVKYAYEDPFLTIAGPIDVGANKIVFDTTIVEPVVSFDVNDYLSITCNDYELDPIEPVTFIDIPAGKIGILNLNTFVYFVSHLGNTEKIAVKYNSNAFDTRGGSGSANTYPCTSVDIHADVAAALNANKLDFGGWYRSPKPFDIPTNQLVQFYNAVKSDTFYAKMTAELQFDRREGTGNNYPLPGTGGYLRMVVVYDDFIDFDTYYKNLGITDYILPSKANLDLAGWETDSNVFYDYKTPIKEHLLNLHAVYLPLVTFVNYYDDAAAPNYSVHVFYTGGTVTKPADPTRANSTFGGWYITTANGVELFDFSKGISTNTTLYAMWNNIIKLNVTFNSNGGSAVSAATVELNAKVAKPADPTRSGYTFAGWTLNGVAYDFNSPVTNNITLDANWTQNAGYTNPFTDVKDNAWYADAVEYMYSNGYIMGTSTTKFSPNANITRGMIIAILYRINGSPTTTASNPFTDVSNNQYYADAVKWGSANGIIVGYGNNKFGPNDLITREQLAAIIYRYEQFTGVAPADINPAKNFADASKISSYAKDAVDAMTKQGIIIGQTATTFAPKANATRAEATMMLFRYLTY